MFFYFGPTPDQNTIRSTRICAPTHTFVVMLTAALLLVSTVDAAPPTPLTIAEAEDLALRDEPGLAELRASADALEEQSVAVGQLPDPSLRVGLANYPINGGSFSTEGMTQAQLGIRQVFPRGRLRAMNTDRYRALAAVEVQGAEARERSVIEATRAAWLESYYWQSAEQVLKDSRPLFDDLFQVTQSKYAVGRNTQSDVLRAELELRRLDDRVLDANRSQMAAQGSLSQWLGSDAYRPAAKKLPDWEQLPALQALQANLAGHPALHAADARIDVGEANVGMAEEKGKPGWALDLGYGYRDGFLPNGDPRSDFVSLSVVVDLPVFKRNRQDRDLAAALNSRRAAVSGKNRVAADLRSQLNVEYGNWTDLSRRLTLYETDILELTRRRAEAAMLAYQSDAGDFSDVMLGQIDYLNTQLEHIRLTVERAQSYAALANLGGLPR
jgi:outer membrane protein TolC